MISVLLSAFNESANPYFWETLANLEALRVLGLDLEVIVGATPGRDDTFQRLSSQKLNWVEVETTKRADRYNAALKNVNCGMNDWIVLNHPRSVLEPDAFLVLKTLECRNHWGAFTHEFDHQHPVLKYTSWWSNQVRGDLKMIFYLDHCLFVRRWALEAVGGIPELEIFEDTVLSKDLNKLSEPLRLPWRSRTSAQRFTTNGFFKQSLMNQMLKCQYLLGAENEKMNVSYEKGLNLNR